MFSQSSPGAVLYIVEKYVAGMATGRRRLETNHLFNIAARLVVFASFIIPYRCDRTIVPKTTQQTLPVLFNPPVWQFLSLFSCKPFDKARLIPPRRQTDGSVFPKASFSLIFRDNDSWSTWDRPVLFNLPYAATLVSGEMLVVTEFHSRGFMSEKRIS